MKRKKKVDPQIYVNFPLFQVVALKQSSLSEIDVISTVPSNNKPHIPYTIKI